MDRSKYAKLIVQEATWGASGLAGLIGLFVIGGFSFTKWSGPILDGIILLLFLALLPVYVLSTSYRLHERLHKRATRAIRRLGSELKKLRAKKSEAWLFFEKEIGRICAEGERLVDPTESVDARPFLAQGEALLKLGISDSSARLFYIGKDGATLRSPPNSFKIGILGHLQRLGEVMEKLDEIEIKADFPEKWAEWKKS